MHKTKKEVFAILSSLGYACMQGYQEVFNDLPAITFTIGSQSQRYDLDKKVIASDIETIVDVWANESVQLSSIADEVESVMRENGYLLNYSTDVPAPEGCLYHYQMRFGGIK